MDLGGTFDHLINNLTANHENLISSGDEDSDVDI
jgi:hypothetical protein